jgi:hypothetical protein
MACGFPRKARCPSGLAAVTARRAGRGDPRVPRPQDACNCPRAAARRDLNTPAPASAPSSAPGQFPAVPDARAEPEPITEPEQNYDVHRIGNGQPIGRPPGHVTACLSAVRSGDEDDPVPGLPPAKRAELPGHRAGWLIQAGLQAAHRGT